MGPLYNKILIINFYLPAVPFKVNLGVCFIHPQRENICLVHVSLVPQPSSTGEHKTKPTQASVRELRGLGLSPDFIVCRSEKPVDEAIKFKISNFCHVSPEQVRIKNWCDIEVLIAL